MPRYNSQRIYGAARVEDAKGSPTRHFVVEYLYGTTEANDTYLLFRVYRRKLSGNEKAAGFPDTTKYLVDDLHTRILPKAAKLARKLIAERFPDVKPSLTFSKG